MPTPAPTPLPRSLPALPPALSQTLWRGHQLGDAGHAVVASGHDALDRELPGGGWPCGNLTELLQPQSCLTEFALLGLALADIVRRDGTLLLVSPPQPPHLPGLRLRGIDERHLVWIDATTPAERLWATEQALRANPRGAVLAWLPQARPEQIRRLQTHAQRCDGPVFLFRPAASHGEPSAAPLRVQVDVAAAGRLCVHILKRRGPPHEGTIELAALAPALGRILAHRMRDRATSQDTSHAVLAGAHPTARTAHA